MGKSANSQNSYWTGITGCRVFHLLNDKSGRHKINYSMVIFLIKTRGYMIKSWKRLCAEMETVFSPLIMWCSQTHCRRLEITCKVLLPLIFSSALHKINLYFAVENAGLMMQMWKRESFPVQVPRILLRSSNT